MLVTLFRIIVFVHLFSSYIPLVSSIFLKVSAPRFVRSGTSVTLFCDYDLEGRPLYALKWYRGNREFFRYIPRELTRITAFPFPGLNVDLSASNPHHVKLLNMSEDISGPFTCEVSVDGSFRTASSAVNITVIDIRTKKPYLNISNPVKSKEKCDINCYVPVTDPQPTVTFYANNQQVDESFLRRFSKGMVQLDALALQQHSFKPDRRGLLSPISVRCEATVPGFYRLSSARVSILPVYKSQLVSRSNCINSYDWTLLILCCSTVLIRQLSCYFHICDFGFV